MLGGGGGRLAVAETEFDQDEKGQEQSKAKTDKTDRQTDRQTDRERESKCGKGVTREKFIRSRPKFPPKIRFFRFFSFLFFFF